MTIFISVKKVRQNNLPAAFIQVYCMLEFFLFIFIYIYIYLLYLSVRERSNDSMVSIAPVPLLNTSSESKLSLEAHTQPKSM